MLTAQNALHGYTSEDSAYLVDDYPYGFRLRTQIRYWIETTKHGDRLCSQTLNPTTDKWNKPKRSTYAPVGCMILDNDNHVTWSALSDYSEEPIWSEFLAVMEGHLNEGQKDQIARILGLRKAFEGVTYSIHEGVQTPDERLEQARIENVLANRAARAASEIRPTL